MNYKIVKYEKKYEYSCAELIRDTWNLHSGFKNIKNVMPIYIAYVRCCADYSLHLEAIVDENDNLKGVLFGSIERAEFKNNTKLNSNKFKTYF